MLKTDKLSAELTNVNLRIQKHGDERVPAADLKFAFQLPSTDLDAIAPGLKETLYRQPQKGDQMELAGGPEAWTALRHPDLEPVRLKGKFPGYELALREPNASNPAAFFGLIDVELKKITLEAHEGGTVSITVTASMPVDDEEVADITAFLREGDVLLSLIPPTQDKQQPVADAATLDEDATSKESAALH